MRAVTNAPIKTPRISPARPRLFNFNRNAAESGLKVIAAFSKSNHINRRAKTMKLSEKL